MFYPRGRFALEYMDKECIDLTPALLGVL